MKELIPEFYSQPEFLLNSNGFDLGCKQVRQAVAICKCGGGGRQ